MYINIITPHTPVFCLSYWVEILNAKIFGSGNASKLRLSIAIFIDERVFIFAVCVANSCAENASPFDVAGQHLGVERSIEAHHFAEAPRVLASAEFASASSPK
jgi:hypothetical protein